LARCRASADSRSTAVKSSTASPHRPSLSYEMPLRAAPRARCQQARSS